MLALVLLLGFSLRMYHVTYPATGYFAAKEVQSLSIARGFLDYGDFSRRRILYYAGLEEGPGLDEEYPQVPFISFLAYALWQLFPASIVAARMVIVASSMGAIVMANLVVRKLGGGHVLSLLTAFYVAVLPLSAYFGRCFQPDMPAFLLLLLLTYFFLRWTATFRIVDLCLFNVFFVLTAFAKLNFLLGAIPLAFVLPLERLRDGQGKAELRRAGLSLACSAAVIGGWLLSLSSSLEHEKTIFSGIASYHYNFSAEYWTRMWPILLSHVTRNYSRPLLLAFVAGLLIAVRERRTMVGRYMIGSAAFLAAHFLVTMEQTAVHPYYQMPLLLFASLGIALAVERACSFLSSLARAVLHVPAEARYLVVAVGMSLSLWSVLPDLMWHYDTIATGVEVAGRYIREHSSPEERVFMAYGSPSDSAKTNFRTNLFGLFLEANRRGTLLPRSLERIVFGENERHVSWILLYQVQFWPQDYAIAEHIVDNYSIVQIGYLEDEILYFLLRKGGKFEPDVLNSRPKVLAREYAFSDGTKSLYVRERP